MTTRYEDRTKDDLLELARERGIENTSKMTKDVLIAALRSDTLAAPKPNPGSGAKLLLHGLVPGEDATLHVRRSSPVVVESPGETLATVTVGEDGSVEFACAPGPYVVLSGGRVVEALAKTDAPAQLPPADRGADVTVTGARSTASRRN